MDDSGGSGSGSGNGLAFFGVWCRFLSCLGVFFCGFFISAKGFGRCDFPLGSFIACVLASCHDLEHTMSFKFLETWLWYLRDIFVES